MTLWIILTSVLALLFFLLTRWIGVRLQGDEGGLVLSASFSKWQFTLYSGGSDEEVEEKEEHKDDEGENAEWKTKDRIKNAVGWLRLASDFPDLIKNDLNFLCNYGRIGQLDLRGGVGAGDPYLTGILSGLIETLKGVLNQAVPSAMIDLRPEFREEKLDLAGTFAAEIRLVHLVFLIIFTLWNLPMRRVWRLARSS